MLGDSYTMARELALSSAARTKGRLQRPAVVPQLQPRRVELTLDTMRHLVDPEGREWRIYERPAAERSPIARSSLVFDTDGIVRRVWRYPASWSALPDADLLRLMDTLRRETPVV